MKENKFIVVGDTILDIYHYGKALKMSVETPTIVGKEERVETSFGGGALFVRNLLELGASVTFASLFGNDEAGRTAQEWNHPRLNKKFFVEKGRTTTAKERFWVDGYKLLQWDHIDNRDLSSATAATLLKFVKQKLLSHDALLISDYRHGLLTKKLAGTLVSLAHHAKKPVWVDSQVAQRESNHTWYKGADLFVLNTKEAQSVDPKFSFAGLAKLLKAKTIVMKMGEAGCVGYVGKKMIKIKGRRVPVKDVSGAGDAFFAALATGADVPARRDLEKANAWAALSVTVAGAHPPSLAAFQKIKI